MNLIETIHEVSGDISKSKKITPEELNNLGYIFSGRQLLIGKKGRNVPTFIVHELFNDDGTKNIVSFCYLYSNKMKTGVILTKEYGYFLRHAEV